MILGINKNCYLSSSVSLKLSRKLRDAYFLGQISLLYVSVSVSFVFTVLYKSNSMAKVMPKLFIIKKVTAQETL